MTQKKSQKSTATRKTKTAKKRFKTTRQNKMIAIVAMIIIAARIILAPEMVALLSSRWANMVTIVAILSLVLVYMAGSQSVFTYVSNLLPQRCDDDEEEESEMETDELDDEEIVQVQGGKPLRNSEEEMQAVRRRRTVTVEAPEAPVVESKKAKPVNAEQPEQIPPKPVLPDGFMALYNPDTKNWVVLPVPAAKQPTESQVIDADATVS